MDSTLFEKPINYINSQKNLQSQQQYNNSSSSNPTSKYHFQSRQSQDQSSINPLAEPDKFNQSHMDRVHSQQNDQNTGNFDKFKQDQQNKDMNIQDQQFNMQQQNQQYLQLQKQNQNQNVDNQQQQNQNQQNIPEQYKQQQEDNFKQQQKLQEEQNNLQSDEYWNFQNQFIRNQNLYTTEISKNSSKLDNSDNYSVQTNTTAQIYVKFIKNNEVHRTRPKITKQTPENLNDQLKKTSQIYNQLQLDQSNLNQKLSKVEEEQQFYYKLITSVEKHIFKQAGYKIGNKNQFVLNLEKEIRNTKIDIYKSEQKIKDQQKHKNFTKQLELDIELSIIEVEKKKIDSILKYTQSQIQELQNPLNIQNLSSSTILFQDQKSSTFDSNQYYQKLTKQALKNQISQQKAELQSAQNEIDQNYVTRDILDRQNESLVSKISHLKQQLNNSNDEALNLRRTIKQFEYNKLKLQKQKEKEEKEKRDRQQIQSKLLSRQEIEFRDYTQLIEIQNNEIQNLKKLEQELGLNNQIVFSDVKQYIKDLNQTKIQLKENIKHVKQVLHDQKQLINNQIDNIQDNDLRNQLIDLNTLPQIDHKLQQGEFIINHDILNKKPVTQEQKQQVQTIQNVEKSDVKIIAQEINFRLCQQGLSMYQAFKKLFTNKIKQKGRISIAYLKNKLQKEPFYVPDQNDALLLARYLVEDNQEKIYEIQNERSQTYRIVKSVFKNILGDILDYQSAEKERKIWEYCHININKVGSTMLDLIKNDKFYKENGWLDSQDLTDIIQQLLYDDINSEYLNYIYFRLYEVSGNFKQLKAEKLFEIFQKGKFIPLQFRVQNFIPASLLKQDKLNSQRSMQSSGQTNSYKGDDTILGGGDQNLMSKVDLDELTKRHRKQGSQASYQFSQNDSQQNVQSQNYIQSQTPRNNQYSTNNNQNKQSQINSGYQTSKTYNHNQISKYQDYENNQKENK